MNKKAVYGILLAILLPVTGYFLLKTSSSRAVAMPRHFFPDSIITQTRNGKQYEDTVWHKLPDMTLTNQLGKQVTWKDLEAKDSNDNNEQGIIVADFFFTHCPTICPTLTHVMKELQQGIKSHERIGNREPNFIHFLSFSIDPERDSVPCLKAWADRYGVNPQNWWLLTGDKKQIYNLAIQEMKLPTVDGGNVDSNFVHTDMFVLIDKYRQIRGYYHMLKPDRTPDSASIERLTNDIILLALEKDPKKKFFLAGKLELIAVVFGILIVGIILLFIFLKKERSRL